MFAKKFIALLVIAGASSAVLAAAPTKITPASEKVYGYVAPDAGFKSTLTREQVAPSKIVLAENKTYGFVEADRGFVSKKSRADVIAEQARAPKQYGNTNSIYFGN